MHVMTDPAWPAKLAAWSEFAAATLTLVLVLMAYFAWRTAKDTLDASRRASKAATVSAEAARAANEQARLDSIEQTRPYVYAEVVPGLAGLTTWDIRVANVGKSAARRLTIAFDSWPAEKDDVADSLSEFFDTERTLPPGCSIRAMWRLEGNFTDGTTEAGLGKRGRLTVRYESDDPSANPYVDVFDVMIDRSGLWPHPEGGPTPDGLKGEARKYYLLGQTLVRRVGELGR